MIPSVAQETIVHICVRNCMILCFVLFSLCFFFSPEQQIPTIHDLRTAIATEEVTHSMQDKKGGNDKQ